MSKVFGRTEVPGLLPFGFSRWLPGLQEARLNGLETSPLASFRPFWAVFSRVSSRFQALWLTFSRCQAVPLDGPCAPPPGLSASSRERGMAAVGGLSCRTWQGRGATVST